MIDEKTNSLINARLLALYEEATPRFLEEWSLAFGEKPPCRINEFGIIDVRRYDAENGILFIGRETNGWDDADYEAGCLFRRWLCDISRDGIGGTGHVSKHPNMWYNIGRWALLLREPERAIDSLARVKDEAVDALGTIAFTNINKVKGRSHIGEEYYRLLGSETVKNLIREEVAIINPRIIVACGTGYPLTSWLPDYKGKIISMNHPAARKSTEAMLRNLKSQLDT